MTRRRAARALSIAGSDSGAGAGIQADLKTFAARGVYGCTVLTAITAQNTRGVRSVMALPASFVRAQLDAVLDDFGADAVKIGMLHDAAVVTTVARVLAARRARHVVVDPVFVAKSGVRLLDRAGIDALRRRLLPITEVLTPNLAEAAALVGYAVEDPAAMIRAGRALLELGPRAVVVKGGHLTGGAIDVLVTRHGVEILRGRRIGGAAPHGTGCTFAAAIAAELAKGATIAAAVRVAKRYTAACIRRARLLGGGQPILGHAPTRGAASRAAGTGRRRDARASAVR